MLESPQKQHVDAGVSCGTDLRYHSLRLLGENLFWDYRTTIDRLGLLGHRFGVAGCRHRSTVVLRWNTASGVAENHRRLGLAEHRF